MRTLVSLPSFLFVSLLATVAGCGVRTGVQVRGAGSDGGVPSDGRVTDMGRDAPWDGGSCVSDLACDDGLFCDGIERCVSGHCQRAVPTDCNDGIDCTTDQCVEGAGCISRVNDALCPPGQTCTAGGCLPRMTNCMTDVDCDDHVMCNGVEHCDVATAQCFASPPPDCSDPISCTDDACIEGVGCVHTANSFECMPNQVCDAMVGCITRMCGPAGCDDHDPCNGVESCGADGVCHHGDNPVCNDGNPCTVDFCQTGVGCLSRPAQEVCGDGVDNDCNGETDCADPFCAIVPMCRGCVPTSTFENVCNDGIDNDCDGLIDCAWMGCLPTPFCNMCVPVAPREVSCFDGRDDDCDGAVDCFDPDCGLTCFGDGGFIEDAGCTSTGFELCLNGIDDNCNGLIDCADPQCRGSGLCDFRDTGPVCTFPENCHNGVDDDCNGLSDCMDPFCFMTDPSCRPMCVPTSRIELRCFDGIDDDCDGRIDCADSDCRARPGCIDAGPPDSGPIRDGGLDSSVPLFDAGSVSHELGVAACTNGIDDDHDGRTDCLDPDCRPLGAMSECCNGIDDTGDGNIDEFTCRCFDQSFCGDVGSLDQVCWVDSYSVCAPRCNFYGGNTFCAMNLPAMPTCNMATGECQ